MKERITLTIDERLLKQVDAMVDGSLVKNRSHAVELLLGRGMGQQKLRKALVLAGGPKSAERALKVVGDKAVIEHNLDLLRKHDIRSVVIAAPQADPAIKEALGDGKRLGLEITYVDEPVPLGTAGSLKFSKVHLPETFVMLNCDELKDVNLADMYAHHKGSGALVTMALTAASDQRGYGQAVLEGALIKSFVEKPEGPGAASLINGGLYIMDPEVFDHIPEGFSMIEHDVFPALAGRGRLYGYIFSGQWFDTDTEKDLERARRDWKGIV